MPTIALYSGGGVSDHVHIEEDITSQVDGYKLTFTTSQEYIPGSLRVVYSGVYYTIDNDFYETDGYGVASTTQFTLVNDDPFPPEVGCPLVVIYRRSL
jgi:hypothetical protein